MDTSEQGLSCDASGMNFNGIARELGGLTSGDYLIENRLLTVANTVYPGATFSYQYLSHSGVNAVGSWNSIRGNSTGDMGLSRPASGNYLEMKLTFSQPINFKINELIELLGDTGGTDRMVFTLPSNNAYYTYYDPGTPDLTINSQTSNALDVTFISPNADNNWEIQFYHVTEMVARFNSIGVDNTVVLNFTPCQPVLTDTDGDTISDYLDLDSDNDGCLDAIEGDENVTLVQLVTRSGSVSVGSGSTAANSNLGTSIDTNGVPTLVNTGGAANTGSDVGQGAGSSQTSAVIAPECLNLCVVSASNPDSDGDTIPNFCDYDDDNDGILDVDEYCAITSTGRVLAYNQGNSGTFLNPTILNTNVIASAVDEVAGSGITISQTTTSMYIQNANTSNYGAARTANDYLQFSFTTTSTIGPGTTLSNLSVATIPSTSVSLAFLSGPYKIAAEITNNTTGLTRLLALDTEIKDASGNNPGAYLEVYLNTPYYLLSASTNYTIKLYVYGGTANGKILFDDFRIYSSLRCTKDTDGDTIPDYLDLDSDNDGCVDAIEGGGNFVAGDLTTTSSTGIGIGTGSPALAPRNFGTVVVTPSTSPLLGVPTAVGTGQTVGDSTNSLAVTCATTPFTCSSAMYISGTDPSNGIYTYNNATNPATKTLVGSPATVSINAIGYNTNDNYIYGIVGGGAGSNKYLYKVDGNGVFYNLGLLPELYTSGTLIAGDFADDGYLYVRQGSNSITFFRINVATRAVTTITMTEGGVPLTNFNTADFAYSGGKFWTIDYISPIRLASFTTAGVVEHKSYVFASAPGYGAMFADSNGNIFGTVANPSATAKFVQFNTTTGTTTTISDAVSTGSLDGAHCLNAPINFATDLAVTKDDGITQYTAGTTNTYTIKVTNNGPFGATNVNFTDTLPTGITAANIVSIVTANGATTSLTAGATSGAAINDVINLSAPTDTNSDGIFDVFSSITYTITIDVPSTYTGDFTNTAAVAFPTGSSFSDSNPSNNTAIDTDSGACYIPATIGDAETTNHGITLLQRAGSDNGNWPMLRNTAFTALESNTKGFVITRLTTSEISAIESPVEGMMVYDLSIGCLKINTDGTSGGWSCFLTPACP